MTALELCVKDRPAPSHIPVSTPEERPQPILLRLEAVPATAQNLDRVRQRIHELNRRLAAAGTPFRLRVV